MKKFVRVLTWILETLLVFGFISTVFYFAYVLNKNLFIFFIFLTFLLNAICMLIIFNQKRTQSSKLSWLLMMMVLPILGHLFYFTFGSKYKNKLEKKIYKSKKYHLLTYPELFETNRKPHTPIEKLNQTLFLPGNYTFYNEPYNYFNDLMNELKNAQKHIFIISYIVKPGELLDTLASILEQKANEGIKIFWLIDDFGRTFVRSKYFDRLKSHANVKISFISKVIYPFIHSENFYRNHQKFFIIDSKKVFAGGCNISDEYISLSAKYGRWVDLNYSLAGQQINAYILLFLRYWHLWTKKPLKIEDYLNFENQNIADSSGLLIYDSPIFDTSTLEVNLLELLSRAKKTIKIATPYFSVPNSIMATLEMLLKSGVEIEIYFPELPDKRLIYQVSLNELKKLQKYGLKLYLYKDSFLHSKIGLIDDEIAFIGSSNMDMRSMYAQYEIFEILKGKAVQDIALVFEEYKENSKIHLFQNKNKLGSLIRNTFFEALRPLV